MQYHTAARDHFPSDQQINHNHPLTTTIAIFACGYFDFCVQFLRLSGTPRLKKSRFSRAGGAPARENPLMPLAQENQNPKKKIKFQIIGNPNPRSGHPTATAAKSGRGTAAAARSGQGAAAAAGSGHGEGAAAPGRLARASGGEKVERPVK